MKRRRLGQHYLVDGSVIDRTLAEASPLPGERVLEIGSGKGALTERLADVSTKFTAYEIDPENYSETLSRVRGSNVEVRMADPFSGKLKFDVLVSSLPYSESSRFVDWLAQAKYRKGAVILQEDFARKLLAQPGTRNYRAVSAISQISSNVGVVCPVLRSAFEPPPRVNSVLVSISPLRKMTSSEIAHVKRLFSLRRRRISSVLDELGFESTRKYGNRRVYSLTPREVIEICGNRPSK